MSKGIEKGYGRLPYNYVIQGMAEDWSIMLRNEWINTGVFRFVGAVLTAIGMGGVTGRIAAEAAPTVVAGKAGCRSGGRMPGVGAGLEPALFFLVT